MYKMFYLSRFSVLQENLKNALGFSKYNAGTPGIASMTSKIGMYIYQLVWLGGSG